MLEKIIELTADTLGANAAEITAETSFMDDLHADSLDLFELAMALEEEFSVEIPSEDLTQITTVGDAMNYLTEHDHKRTHVQGRAGAEGRNPGGVGRDDLLDGLNVDAKPSANLFTDQ